ncbi:MAG: type IV pili twitching motility protein PilT [Candidatus Yanofskybacteria bacterium RIFCSPLOWO2_01_FULL_41_34]|uniref:Type IV pili twitching motility protein PilT n=1 Tax=Candidatus Yanofskybacteria bacterium RIFCSPHIGHO2_01_FULL_41_26 TaxID=1802661 RepID=A0A1F8EDU8_9BACT|nr:MAG: type IV pili twitching motility protein PilT [Candidatus Yanofskybacteria bacterium RIFCSPHIGHO2_01_FULL_41_26]OGN21116.1 MAG: type IV pili twitching motility protein PilT [Candidatus Yanofskybacteria bacterium RIFCSPLOWO2_01_FULL_41_34]
MEPKQYLEELLLATAQQGATDLHLSPGHYPTLRIDSRLITLSQQKILDKETLEGLVFVLLGQESKARFLSEKELDFSYELEGKNRFRVNTYQTKGGPAASLRLIPNEVKTIDELNLPQITKLFSKLSQGFVLVVGPNGHGKSTTLASIIDMINKERAEKIVTIEDPIEYIFTPEKSIIDQREVYQDTFSFHKALRSTFRQNVNVIMVGEMRDYETMSAAVTAAETGHLVLASLHTNSASQTIERIIDNFPPNQESQIRNQLANTISGIISQRLIPRIKGGLIPAVEVMIATPAIRTLIRDNRPKQMDMVIETSQDVGMISLDRSLADLVRKKEISLERAEFYSLNQAELRNLL